MLIWLAAAWLAGLTLGLLADAPPLPLLLLCSAALPLGLLFRLGRLPATPVILAALVLLGFWRVEAAGPGTPQLPDRDRQTATLTGWVRDSPQTAGGMVRFTFEAVSIEPQTGVLDVSDPGNGAAPFSAKVLVYATPPESLVKSREPPHFAYGDPLVLKGVFTKPGADSDPGLAAYLSSRGIAGVFWSREAAIDDVPAAKRPARWRGWLPDLRQRLAASLDQGLPFPQSTLAKALLLGLRNDLPPKVVDDFRQTGTAHVLAISGLHVSTLLLLALGLVGATWGRRLPLYVLAPLAAVWLYVLLSGAPVSAIRAGTMGSILLAGWALGRPHRVLPALALAAAVMAGLEPGILRQVSFQLSFAAVAGIGLALPFQPAIAGYAVRKLSPRQPLIFDGGHGFDGGRGNTGQDNHGQGGRDEGVQLWESWRAGILTWVATAGLVSLAATLATWPLVAFYFGTIPWLGIPATMLVLPALPFALVGAVATSIAGLVHPLAGETVGWLAWIPLSYIMKVAAWTPHLTSPGSWVTGPLVAGCYLVLAGLVLLPGGAMRVARRAGWRPEQSEEGASVIGLGASGTGLGASGPGAEPGASGEATGVWTRLGPAMGVLALAAAAMLWWQVLSGPDGKLHVYFFDVGQGDSALIVTPSGKQVVVDGGPGSLGAVRNLSRVMPMGDRSIDLVVLTHLDADHSRGLFEVLDRFSVGSAIVGSGDERPGDAGSGDAGAGGAESVMYPQWEKALERSGLTPLTVESGYRVRLEPDVVLEVLNPFPPGRRFPGGDSNNNGVTLRLVYGDTRMLLAADIEREAEALLTRSGVPLDSQVLKVPHHGSKTSSTTAFLEAVNPKVAVISAGEDNQHGHPAPPVVDRLEEFVGQEGLFRTDRDGTIEFISDGERLWVKTH